jgi:uncharacterized protein
MKQASQAPTAISTPRLANPWLFFVVTFGITWSFWLSAIVFGLNFESALGLLLLLCGLTGPGLAGIGFVHFVYGESGRKDFWSRITDVGRVGGRWFLTILLLPAALVVAAALLDMLLGGPGPVWGQGVRELGSNPFAILPAIFFATLPPLLEELGWRGYALDRLQVNLSALTASLILGVVWAVWHLPLFFIDGSYQHDVVGFGTLEFWMFMVGVVALSVAFTWVYNHTARSILAIILFHGMVNFAGETIEITQRAEIVFTALWIGFAALLAVLWGARLSRDAEPPPGGSFPPPAPDEEAQGGTQPSLASGPP